jgi:hypothetical protein
LDDTKTGSGTEFSPVAGTTKPVQIVAQELIRGGSGIHEGVAGGDGGMEDGASWFQCRLKQFKT